MIKFGPSGNSESFYLEGYTHTEEAAKYVKERGLDCFEYSFGRGVRMSEEKAVSIRRAFEAQGVEISIHAPYFINFANPSDEMAAKSYEYVLQSGNMARLMGAKRVVFHPAAQGKAERADAVALTKERLKILRDYIYMNGLQTIKFCPETMGKLAQIGTVEEIAEFCAIDTVFTPCVDFGHVNAREGGSLKTKEDYLSLLNIFTDRLGVERMRDFHVHFSKIMYSAKGEIKHLTFADEVYGPEFAPLAAALKQTGLQPYIVCESDGTQAEDAAEMKKIYNSAF